jgi:hypothetical protein
MSSSSPNDTGSFKLAVVGLWLHIPAYVFLLRCLLLHASDYSLDLSSTTLSLVGRGTLIAVSVVSVVVLFVVLTIRGGDNRRRFIEVACFAGVFVHLVWAFFCFGPALSLLQKLG